MNDQQIINAFKHNDTQKMHEAIATYSPLLFYVAHKILQDKGVTEDIEECVADVFVYLWQHPNYFNPQKGSLKNYLCLIVKSKSLDQYRKLSKLQELHIPLDFILEGTIPSSNFILYNKLTNLDYEYEDLYYALDMLSSHDKDILLRRFIAGEKPSHIAKTLGVPTKSIVNNLYHSKNKLKLLMQPGGPL